MATVPTTAASATNAATAATPASKPSPTRAQRRPLQPIARRYNTSVADIKRSNNLSGSMLRPGQRLRVSGGT
ncbi:LysM peptidoglycan-binding domain-containing protein [Eikenella sp. Marseille-P7795]|uniref:LysM peptidoglycan-binding domain-containing protein n=1 Tax=Eikenella sp. Marseille-P7795 TaxID=2866577 RepID=UPI001CE4262D|nr:LysM peptidoglycan-binding domain-containing protein [Eikenella sp. Marseille-P7795]